MRKAALVLILFLASTAAAIADMWPIRSYLDILGEYSGVINARELMSVPAGGATPSVHFAPTLAFNGVFMFGGNDGIFALYLKNDYISVVNKHTVRFSASSHARVDEQWGLAYLGLGGRKYFFTDDFYVMRVLPYASIDLGPYFATFTNSKVTVIDDTSGSILGSGEREAAGMIFGLNLETGADFWLSNDFGITAKAGYRFCNGTIRSEKTGGSSALSLTGVGISDITDCRIDYSGFFVQLGVSFNFQRYD